MKLSNMIPLRSKITVYVPATVDVNKEIDNTPRLSASRVCCPPPLVVLQLPRWLVTGWPVITA